jgi:membrane protein
VKLASGDTASERTAPLWTAIAAACLLAAVFNSHHADAELAVAGNDAGRGATTPSEIPAKGWLDIVKRVYKDISTHRILAIAAGVTFYAILAVFPAVAALVALYGLFADTGTIASNLDRLAALLPGGAIEVVRDQMTRVAAQGHGQLGLTFAIGLGMALWSANAGIKAVFDALNVVYDEEEKRGFIKLNAVSLGFTAATIIFMVLAMAAVVVLPGVLQAMWPGEGKDAILRLVMAPALLVVVGLGLAVLYRYGPSRKHVRWRWISWGSAFAAIAWVAASILFSWYAANFGSFNKTYGSLGAIIGFMTWIWISAIVLLIGAEINAKIEQQAAGRKAKPGQPATLNWPPISRVIKSVSREACGGQEATKGHCHGNRVWQAGLRPAKLAA